VNEGERVICETKALNDLVSAIIVQAAIDYVDAHRKGLVKAGRVVDEDALRQLLQRSYPCRTPLPKWMEPPDVYSCVWFLFGSNCLEDFAPTAWTISPSAIRAAVDKAVVEGGKLNHFFYNDESTDNRNYWAGW